MNKRAFFVGACVLAIVLFFSVAVNQEYNTDALDKIVTDEPSTRETRDKEKITVVTQQKKTLNILLPAAKIDSILEWEFMKTVLLGELDRPLEFHMYPNIDIAHKEDWKYMNDSMSFTFFRNAFNAPADDYFKWVREQGGYNLGVFHMGDEVHKASIKYYEQADYAIRNYYFQDIHDTYGEKAIWVPNGYAFGVGPRDPEKLVKASQRTLNCHYAGRKTKEREAFIETVNKVAPNVCVLETTKSFGKGLPRAEYGDQMSNVVIAPCPIGNTLETIRFHDALECGAIPAMTDSPYAQMLLKEFEKFAPDPNDYVTTSRGQKIGPFILVNDWTEFNEEMTSSILGDKEMLDKIQGNAIGWWTYFKKQKALEIKRAVDKSFEKYYGKGA